MKRFGFGILVVIRVIFLKFALKYTWILAYKELLQAMKDFDIRYCIGTGAYDSVYKAQLPTGRVVALEKLHSAEAEVQAFTRSSFLNKAGGYWVGNSYIIPAENIVAALKGSRKLFFPFQKLSLRLKFSMSLEAKQGLGGEFLRIKDAQAVLELKEK